MGGPGVQMENYVEIWSYLKAFLCMFSQLEHCLCKLPSQVNKA